MIHTDYFRPKDNIHIVKFYIKSNSYIIKTFNKQLITNWVSIKYVKRILVKIATNHSYYKIII